MAEYQISNLNKKQFENFFMYRYSIHLYTVILYIDRSTLQC